MIVIRKTSKVHLFILRCCVCTARGASLVRSVVLKERGSGRGVSLVRSVVLKERGSGRGVSPDWSVVLKERGSGRGVDVLSVGHT